MKPLILGITGVALAGWSGLEAALQVNRQLIGPETQVSALLVFQIMTLIGAAVILVKLGMLLAEWRRAINKALAFADQITALEERMSRSELRISAQESRSAQDSMILQEHAVRLGMRDDVQLGGAS